ncbi:MAG TPA: hypothetical protein VF305_00845 [Smithellaceae bacterium]
MEKNYKGFCTSRPFWAGEKPSFSILNRSEHFAKIMEEEIFSYESEVYRLKICKDGMILFRNEELEKNIKKEYEISR